MKKSLLFLSVCLTSSLLYATPASTATTQQFIETIQLEQHIQKLSNSNAFQELTEQIIAYYQIPQTQDNQTRINNAIKKYYQSDAYKQQFQQRLFDIYSKNMSEEELQEWITFYKTPIGKSILNNPEFENKIVNAVEQIFPENAEPSAQAQQKLSQAMEKFFLR
ncbi:DUF2059 domain-containing protein [Acinetobacter sp. Marseille-Q1618]|uniref:DUF2059 domain-containing protein n=1 Tax=Acinetobacter sp. Marseille-Q1618 TaxID=2697502 RepID=UPI001570C6C8|nr:DUF2059 domain-containing protein [Acinetobacter sp. Marseille-Q1618]